MVRVAVAPVMCDDLPQEQKNVFGLFQSQTPHSRPFVCDSLVLPQFTYIKVFFTIQTSCFRTAEHTGGLNAVFSPAVFLKTILLHIFQMRPLSRFQPA